MAGVVAMAERLRLQWEAGLWMDEELRGEAGVERVWVTMVEEV